MFELAVELIDETPALAIDWAVVSRNVAAMAALASERGVALRPHVKTHKLIPLAQLQVACGAVGVTVAKLNEAEAMAAGGISDVLVAYPVVGSSKLRRLLDLAASGINLAVALDSAPAALDLAIAARARSLVVPVLIEIDTGLRRCGVQSAAEALELARLADDQHGTSFAGIATHEGHAYATSGAEGLRQATEDAAGAMREVAQALEDAGLPAKTVSMGSSGTARFGIGLEGTTEFRPGTYVFNDRTQVALGAAAREECAAAIVATVVSRAVPGQAVIDAGSKVLTSDRMLVANPRPTFGELADDPDCEVVRMSEEHGILGGGAVERLAVGDRVAVLPNHICPVVNLFDSVRVLRAGNVERWPVDARGSV